MSRAESYGQRLRNHSESTGVDVQRLRRALVFQRILARLAVSDAWVLKGGFALEVRLALASRATVDLDLVTASTFGSAAALQDKLDELLEPDPDGDEFSFEVATPKRISLEGDRQAWRVTIRAVLGGKVFQEVKLDIVSQFVELSGAVERLRVDPPISVVGLTSTSVLAVDVAQHAAEKFHALSRTYAGDRPSSRVKDLVDLVLLVEAGVLDPRRVHERLLVVYSERDDTKPRPALPQPPASWTADYRALIDRHELSVSANTCALAYALVTDLYATCLNHDPKGQHL